MILKKLAYSEKSPTLKKWELEEFSLGQINLIVGKNASGKSRTLSAINGLANLVSDAKKLTFVSGHYISAFQNESEEIEYELLFESSKVMREIFKKNGKSLLDRGGGGEGDIWSQAEGKSIRFQSPEDQIASKVKRDKIQHPFFEELYDWGNNTVLYSFSSKLGQDKLAVFHKTDKEPEISFKDTERVAYFFKRAFRVYGNDFKKIIISEMCKIGYDISDVDVNEAPNITFSIEGPLQLPPNVLTPSLVYVKENDLPGFTYQTEMSQGMFRALSLLIQMNASKLLKIPSTIIIDDIGEGLDYERSTELVKVLIEKIEGTSSQLIMTTNDRFIMNNVSIEYWHVIQRKGNSVKMINYANSKQIFEDFKFTGLNNFDFFRTDFYEKGLEAE